MVIADLQILPRPSTNDPSRPYAYVEEAIAVIQQSGLQYRVGPLGTAVAGELSAVLTLIEKMSVRVRAAGAEDIITIIKIVDLGDKSVDFLFDLDKFNG